LASSSQDSTKHTLQKLTTLRIATLTKDKSSGNIILQSSPASNAKIIEKLRDKVQHLGQSKVDVVDLELKF
jgi:hypothetical protein